MQRNFGCSLENHSISSANLSHRVADHGGKSHWLLSILLYKFCEPELEHASIVTKIKQNNNNKKKEREEKFNLIKCQERPRTSHENGNYGADVIGGENFWSALMRLNFLCFHKINNTGNKKTIYPLVYIHEQSQMM